MYIGNKEVSKVYLGNKDVSNLYIGTLGSKLKPLVYDNNELESYMEGLSLKLTQNHVSNLDNFITTIKSELNITELSNVFDLIYVFAGETFESSIRNLVARKHDATSDVLPLFSKFKGVTGNGVDMYLDSNFNQLLAEISSYNDVTIGFCSESEVQNSNGMVFGAEGLGSHRLQLRSNDRSFIRLNQESSSSSSIGSVLSSIGFFAYTRTGDIVTGYKNKDIYISDSKTSSELIDNNIYILASNIDNSPGYFSENKLSLFFIGKSLTKDNIDAINDAFVAYKTAITAYYSIDGDLILASLDNDIPYSII